MARNKFIALTNIFNFETLDEALFKVKTLRDGEFEAYDGEEWVAGILPSDDHLAMIMLIIGFHKISQPIPYGVMFETKAQILKLHYELFCVRPEGRYVSNMPPMVIECSELRFK